jgi:predicted transposase/invertase (TIGR01784 family)
VQPVFADPKTDFVFKRIFGVEAHKPLLIALLNDLLDVKCTDATGRRFVVEMQVLKVEGFEKRVVYNASKAYVMQLRGADEYPALCDVVGVTICNFLLWPEQGEGGDFRVPMLSRWKMQEQHGGALGLPQVQYVFLELPKYAAGDAPQTMVEKWAYFFREAKTLEVVPSALSERPFRDALDVARTATFTAGEWEAYERSKMAEQDARGALVVAHGEGRAEGLREGKEEGRREGKEEGRREGEAKGLREGEARGKAAALLTVLAARGLAVDDETRGRIEACTDVARLDRWLARALTAASAREALDDAT